MVPLPKLKSGAGTQYPCARTMTFRTRLLEFVDGSNQSYAERSTPLQGTRLSYKAITVAESHQLQRSVSGAKVQMDKVILADLWVAPATEQLHPSDTLIITYEGYDRTSLVLDFSE